jgi:hypothetical protein
LKSVGLEFKQKKIALDSLSNTPVARSKSDLLKVLGSMEKALYRQHIMWPHEGALPCEVNENCSKSDLCRNMAEEVMDFTRALAAAADN